MIIYEDDFADSLDDDDNNYLSYLEHFGKAHDENPPGRGSGRYGFGTGKEPYRHNPFMH